MAEPSGDATPIGWLRALASAVVILVAGAVLFVFAPNWLLTHLTGLSRNGRVAVVATAFVVVFVAFAWVLRRLQARRVI
jgi:drug/metabolite transporter superfamily protein YnfA